MRAVLQRVSFAEVETEGRTVGRIDRGLLAYVGVAVSDTPDEATGLARKVAGMRIFEDEQDKLNLSVQDVGGKLLVIPNFTLQADTRKGRRPAFVDAAPAQQAEPLHETFRAELRRLGCEVETGVFGAPMTIRSTAEGPVNVMALSPGRWVLPGRPPARRG